MTENKQVMFQMFNSQSIVELKELLAKATD